MRNKTLALFQQQKFYPCSETSQGKNSKRGILSLEAGELHLSLFPNCFALTNPSMAKVLPITGRWMKVKEVLAERHSHKKKPPPSVRGGSILLTAIMRWNAAEWLILSETLLGRSGTTAIRPACVRRQAIPVCLLRKA